MEIELLVSAELRGEYLQILEYMRRYPSFYFRSSRLARVLDLSPYRISKMLLEMHKQGLLERYVRGRAHPASYYRIRK